MKVNVTPKSFDPTAKKVDLSNVDGFDLRRLMAIINVTARAVMYDPASPNRGYSAILSNVVTLQYDTSAHSASDVVVAIYDYPDRGLGVNYSMNVPTLPNIGANFNSSGPYANYVLLRTVAKNLSRSCVEVHNLSGARAVILRDDGTASTGNAPVNPSIIALTGGGSSGEQGSIWKSETFKGRLQIYTPSSDKFVSIFED